MGGRFGDLVTAMVTPFDSDNKVDFEQAQKLAAWLTDNGSDGLVVAGTTGEVPTLSDDEQIELWRAVKDAVGGRAALVGGAGSNDTAHAIHLTKAAEDVGLDGALVVTPYYNKPPQSGLIAHFRAVADSTSLPILLYDIPSRTVTKIAHSTIVELAQVDNIVGIKDAAGSAQGAARIVADTPEGFQLYSGNDGDTLPWLSVGAVGVIAVASHVVGPRMAEMIKLFKSGDVEGARKIDLSLIPVFDAMGLTSNPIPVKASLELMGHPVGPPRMPLPPATDVEIAQLKEILTAAGVL